MNGMPATIQSQTGGNADSKLQVGGQHATSSQSNFDASLAGSAAGVTVLGLPSRPAPWVLTTSHRRCPFRRRFSARRVGVGRGFRFHWRGRLVAGIPRPGTGHVGAEAGAANTDIKIAVTRVDQAAAVTGYARSYLFPTISAQPTADRTREAQNRPEQRRDKRARGHL